MSMALEHAHDLANQEMERFMSESKKELNEREIAGVDNATEHATPSLIVVRGADQATPGSHVASAKLCSCARVCIAPVEVE